MSLCYPWTPPWWRFQTPLILCSGLGVHLSDWHQGSSLGSTSLIPAGILALVSAQVLGSAAGTGSFPLLPWFVLLVPALGRSSWDWELSCGTWLCFLAVVFAAVGDWAGVLQVQGKRWGRESKTGSVSNQSLLMLELPNSVFTHQGLRLMVIYSHFLVNN